jgi:hypothetical protein
MNSAQIVARLVESDSPLEDEDFDLVRELAGPGDFLVL